MNTQAIAFHPASDIFPLMEGEDLEELVQDVREHGLRERITLHPDGSILDGRNRYRACLRVGIKPKFVTWQDDGHPTSFVISLNLKRRQLTPSQRAMIGLKAKPLLEAEAKERLKTAKPGVRGGDPLPTAVGRGEANELAGATVGVSGKSVERAQIVVDRGIPELAAAVRAGDVSVKRAAAIARLSKNAQRQILENGDAEPEQQRKEVYPRRTHPSNKEISEALTFAEMALSQLARIREDDPQREPQLRRVRAWIDRQLDEKEETT